MLTKTLISIGIGVAIGLSPLRDSSLAKILITITNLFYKTIKNYDWIPLFL